MLMMMIKVCVNSTHIVRVWYCINWSLFHQARDGV